MTIGTQTGTITDISFFGTLRRRIGCRELRLEFDSPNVTIRSIMERLIEIQGEDLREWLINDYGWVDSRCMIFIDGEHLPSVGCIDRDVTGAKRIQVALATPMAGG
jgi:molybdopterin converting factor small subunit